MSGMSRPPRKSDSQSPGAAGGGIPFDDFEADALEADESQAFEDSSDAPGIDEQDSGVDLAFGEEGQSRLRAGAEVIHRFWQTLPNLPGVYRMIDAKGDVLYVGKARSLKKRVASYTRGIGHTNRIARMIAETAAMEFVTTATETEALLLEANLIKQLKPRFNVLLRDDKSFPYILHHGGPCVAAAHQASRSAQPAGRVLSAPSPVCGR